MKEKDIFDKLVSLPGLCILEPFYTRNKEMLLYLFFGGLTFLISVVTYAYFAVTLDINELVANVFSWILSVAFAFVTNKVWVFQSKTDTVSAFIQEVCSFFAGRIVTLVLEEVILFVFITRLHWNSLGIKVAAQIVIIVLNYIISKLFVFRK